MKQTITINLKRAAFDRQSVTIAGGIFGPDELKKAAEAIERAPEASELIKEPAATKAKHTPGPWMHQPRTRDGHADLIVTSRGKIPFAQVGNPYPEKPILDYPHENTQTANARLIAAAPELLEALERIASSYETCIRSKTSGKVWEEVAAQNLRFTRNAIAKATGAE